nr:fibronectin type III domain-containing protein [Candidatus Cloacimonadota bacterium]
PQWQAPSNLMANGLSNTDVVLTWDDNSDSEENFMLYFYDTTESLVDSFIIGANVTEKTITDLDPAGYYGFAVQAISQWEKERPLSETEWFDMTDFIFAAPGNLTCQQNYGDMSVELNWVDNSTLETGYCIERKINSNDFVELTQISEINLCTYTDADTTTYAIGDTLVYRVRAYNSYEELIYTNYSNECTVIIVDMQQSIITIHVQVDSYPSEASWNLYNVDTGEFYFDDYQTFSYANQETTVITYLNPGSYTVHCADTFGDGGIAGEVIHNGIQLITWDDDDYGSNGYFSFTVGTE